ncbi:MAG: hypothetical protein ABII02_00880 [Candidatus Magasanikbacteria bacterium]
MNERIEHRFIIGSAILGGTTFFVLICFVLWFFWSMFGGYIYSYNTDGVQISKTWGLLVKPKLTRNDSRKYIFGNHDRGNSFLTKGTCEKAAYRYIEEEGFDSSSSRYICMTECLPFHFLERINQMVDYDKHCKFYEECDGSGCSKLIESKNFQETLENYKL